MAEVTRHADHDPALICRPAGYGLCEPLQVRCDGETAVCGRCGHVYYKSAGHSC